MDRDDDIDELWRHAKVTRLCLWILMVGSILGSAIQTVMVLWALWAVTNGS